jgi:hypothetical protein
MAAYREGALLDRRKLVLGAAGAVASAGAAKSLAWPSGSPAAALPSRKGVLPAPTPIPGGLEIAPGVVIHVFGPGDPAVTLPFSGITLQGFDVEPGTITDFKGSSAVAFHVGTAKGSDGKTYNLETDIRVMEGEYVVDDTVHQGASALI